MKTAALYALYPWRFGYCGPQKKAEKDIVYNYLVGEKVSESKVRKILSDFRAAPFYYRLITKSNDLDDIFNERVTRAYFLGNGLLESVKQEDLKKMVIEDLWKEKRKPFPSLIKAHHSFHVLFVGSVTEGVSVEGKLLDLCRIGWGEVLDFKQRKGKEGVILKYSSLGLEEGKHILKKPTEKFFYIDRRIVPEIRPGDSVSTHWGHVVEVLNKTDLSDLKKYTKQTLSCLYGK